MSRRSLFAEKALSGQRPTEKEWESLLQSCHDAAPSMTPQSFAIHRTKDGLNSYEFLALRLNSPAFRHVIDLGCGDGFFAEALARHRLERFTGVDMNAAELEIARKNYAGRPGFSFVQARAQELPLANGCADALISHMALMLMKPLEPVIAEIARVLRPGGLFAAVVGNRTRKDEVLVQIGRTIQGFFQRKYPEFASMDFANDSRLNEIEGLRSLFSEEMGFLSESVDLEDFSIRMSLDQDRLWNQFRYTYFIEMLSDSDHEELRRDFDKIFLKNARDGKISYDFPMIRISAVRA